MDSPSAPPIIQPARRQRYLDLLERIEGLRRAISAISDSPTPSSPAQIQDQNLRSESIWRFLGARTHADAGAEEEGEEGFSGRFCVVCHSDFSGGESIAKLRCRHEYHAPCIHTWLLRKNFCPVCRQPAVEEFE